MSQRCSEPRGDYRSFDWNPVALRVAMAFKRADLDWPPLRAYFGPLSSIEDNTDSNRQTFADIPRPTCRVS
jgi:hypothetical protein